MTRRPPRWLVALFAATASQAIYWGVQIAQEIASGGIRSTDFGVFWADAVVVRTQGWVAAMGPTACHVLVGPDPCRLVETPAAIAPALPFSFLPLGVAYGLWFGLLLAVLGVAWWLCRPSARVLTNVIWLLLLLGWSVTAHGLYKGNQAALMVGAVAAGGSLLASGRQTAAGLALGLTLFKPQLVILLPPALIVAGFWRAALWMIAALAASAVVDVAVLGPDGVRAYVAVLQWDSTANAAVPVALTQSLPPTIAWTSRAVLAAGTLIAAWMARGDPARAFAIGVVGSLLATPYEHPQDWTALIPAAWLWLRTEPPVWRRWWLAPGYVAGALPGLTRWPVLAFMLGWLVILAIPQHARAWAPVPRQAPELNLDT